jgi:integrase
VAGAGSPVWETVVRGSIIKRTLSDGSTSYAVKWRTRDGKQQWKTIGPRKRDAELFLAEVNRRLVLGTAYRARPETFGEFTDGWLARYRQRVRPATLEVALNSLKHLAVFESDLVESMTAAAVEDHLAALGQRAPRSAELTLDTLKMILRSARERGQMIDEAILRIRKSSRDRAEMRFLTWRQVMDLASETIEPYGNMVRFACLTGLRQGELFALREQNVEFERGLVRVTAGARDGQIVPTKTNAGRRRVSLSTEGAKVLREQLIARPSSEVGLVFPTSGGKVWRKDNFMSRVFRPAVKRARLEPLRFHDLRHTYAALMVAAGAHPKLLQVQLGHTSINVTLNTYGHLFPDAFEGVGDALDRLVHAGAGSTAEAQSKTG